MGKKTPKTQHPKIALACDWLTTPGGAEKVLLELHRMYPDAPIYTSQYSKKGIDWFNDADVRTGWLQIFPKSLRKFLGPLRQLYFSHLDLSEYDLVISVTGAEAKSIITKPRKKTQNPTPSSSHYSTHLDKSQDAGAYHLCYCHVPTQYYWQMYDKYVENPGFGPLNPLVRLAFKLLVKPLRRADYQAAQLPDQFVTISSHAQTQIKRYYDRESIVVFPSVDLTQFSTHFSTDFSTKSRQKSTEISKKSTDSVDFSTKSTKNSTASPQDFHNKSTTSPQNHPTFPQLFHNFSTEIAENLTKDGYYIISCRQVTWKRVDLAIQACQQLGLSLLVVGDGPEHKNLVRLARDSQNIHFLPWTDPKELSQLLQHAKGYIFPSLEPFGIAAVEALAAGCPVIAFAEGGSRDFVKPGVNGLLFAEQTPESLTKALRKFEKTTFDRKKVAASAAPFSVEHFRQGITDIVSKHLPHNSSKIPSQHRRKSKSSPKGANS